MFVFKGELTLGYDGAIETFVSKPATGGEEEGGSARGWETN